MTDEHPVHRYRVRAMWAGTTRDGYDAYPRDHTVSAPPAAGELQLSGDPAFLGDAHLLNPEQLLVAAAVSCQLLSFLAVAARARIDVVGYADDAEGVMAEDETPMSITRIVLRPQISIVGDADEARVRHLVEVAHRECFIANSLKTEIVIEPTITVAPTSA